MDTGSCDILVATELEALLYILTGFLPLIRCSQIRCSLLPAPCSLLPAPCSLLPAPYLNNKKN
ncbi:MAG: hypothetical protein F6K65_28720 [Moorea sp. SIO3C2]|nr:hypothetical protein [Moorena sp. SIO3C2]